MRISLDRHIDVTPGVAGGKPRIAGHRITVQDIVVWHERLGLSADEIAAEHDLSLGDVYAALADYYDHRAELDKAIRSDESYIAELRRCIPSKLSEGIVADRIQFYMDENVPRAVAEGLRRRGVDVLTVQEAGLRSADDRTHLERAAEEARVMFTQDADFLRLHQAGLSHHGIVYAPHQMPIGRIVRRLMLIHEVLNPQQMKNHVEFL